MTSTQWVEYHVGTKRKSYNSLPTSNITAEAVTADGFTLSQTDNAGVTTTAGRSYTANGMILTQTNGRDNTTTTVTDIAGRVLTVTDAAGHVTTTAYDSAHDLPATVTDAQSNTSCYRYDVRGRKVAEWGTGIQSPRGLGGGLDKPRSAFAPKGRADNGVSASQPVMFGYDDADRLVSLTTFRVADETISSDPTGRTDGDTTTWSYHDSSGMETSKPNGMTLTQSYEIQRDLHTGIAYHRGTTLVANRQYSYDTLGRPTARNTSRQGTVKNDTFGYNFSKRVL